MVEQEGRGFAELGPVEQALAQAQAWVWTVGLWGKRFVPEAWESGSGVGLMD